MNTQEVADKLVNYCRKGEFEEATKELYAPSIISVEPKGTPTERAEGIEAVIKKGIEFGNMVEEMHGVEVSDPVVADKFFSCKMAMDVTFKGVGRITMEEVCLYKVEDGKITYEEFFYTPDPQ